MFDFTILFDATMTFTMLRWYSYFRGLDIAPKMFFNAQVTPMKLWVFNFGTLITKSAFSKRLIKE